MLPPQLANAKVRRTAVLLKVCIRETGQVDRVLVLKSTGNVDIDRYFVQDNLLFDFVTTEIRNARIEDAEEILAILNPIIAARCYTAMDTEFTVEVEREFIRTFPAQGIFIVAVDTTSNHIAGFQNVSPFGSFTHAFDHVGVIGTYVDLDLRRQGIATQLFAATHKAARQKGYEKFFSYVRADNEAALKTYQRQGFRVVGTAERQAKINGRYIDEVVIEKVLDALPTAD